MLWAVVGTVLIVLGAVIAAAAPGDGQTGMCCFPLVGIGAVMALIGARSVFSGHPTMAGKLGFTAMAFIWVASFANSFLANVRYSRTLREAKARELNGREED